MEPYADISLESKNCTGIIYNKQVQFVLTALKKKNIGKN
jgi:hypothetical protein